LSVWFIDDFINILRAH